MPSVRPAILNGNGYPVARGEPQERPRLLGPDGKPIQDDNGFLLPHHRTFAAIFNAVSKTYRYTFDEALHNSTENAKAMRRDARLMAKLRERQLPVIQAAWHLEPEDPDDATQQAVAEAVTGDVKKTPNWSKFLLNLEEALWYGRYGIQKRYQWLDTTAGRRLRLTDWRPVNGDKLQFRYTDGAVGVAVNLAEARQYQAAAIGGVSPVQYTDRFPVLFLDRPQWRERFIIHRHEVDDADYFDGEMAGGVQGVGIRHRVYWYWWMRQEIMTWMIDYAERVGIGGLTVFGYDSGNPAAQKRAEKLAQDYNRNEAIAWPCFQGSNRTGEVTRVEAGMGGAEAVRAIIDYFDEAIDGVIIGQDMSSKTQATGIGGDAQADLKGDTKHRILKFDANNLEETLTRDYVRVLKDWNHPEARGFDLYFRFGLDKPNPTDLITAVTALADKGVAFKMDEARELTGMTKPEDGDETIGGREAMLATAGLDPTTGKPFPKGPGEEKDADQHARGGPVGHYAWREGNHPRGQPENAGEFRAKDDATAKEWEERYRKRSLIRGHAWRAQDAVRQLPSLSVDTHRLHEAVASDPDTPLDGVREAIRAKRQETERIVVGVAESFREAKLGPRLTAKLQAQATRLLARLEPAEAEYLRAHEEHRAAHRALLNSEDEPEGEEEARQWRREQRRLQQVRDRAGGRFARALDRYEERVRGGEYQGLVEEIAHRYETRARRQNADDPMPGTEDGDQYQRPDAERRLADVERDIQLLADMLDRPAA